MEDNPIFVIVEITAVSDMAGLQRYSQRASELLGSFGGEVVAQGGYPVADQASFAPLVVQRWTSEKAFRTWLESDAYRPLNEIRAASSTMRVAIVPAIPARIG